MSEIPLPLEGVRVLDFAHMMQGPWAAEMLGDFGADVIKVEAVVGGERGREAGAVLFQGHSAHFLAMNRNKRSIALDLKSDEGLEIARELIRGADILVENFRPGVMDRLGLGWDAVHTINPGLVYCSASGYGRNAPDPRTPGQDLLAQARTGATWLSGVASDAPTPCGPYVADAHAATMLALGAVAALHQRERTGEGLLVEVDLIGAMLHVTTQDVVTAVNGDMEPARAPVPGNPYMEGPYGIYRTADGYIAVSVGSTEQLAEALRSDDLLQQFPGKDAAAIRRDELDEFVAEHLLERPSQESLDALSQAGVWCAPVNRYSEMVDDPYVQWRERRSVRVMHPDAGELELVANPVSFNGEQPAARRHPPLHGEHTREILLELGRDPDALIRAGVAGAQPVPNGGE